MKKITTITVALFLTACASTTTSTDTAAVQTYRLPSGEVWQIGGSMFNEYTTNGYSASASRTFTLLIDGQEAITGSLDLMGRGELSGGWEGHQINVICTSEQVSSDWIEVNCLTLVNNQRAVTLTL